MEPDLLNFIRLLIHLSAFRSGDILDAGAFDGQSAMMLAGLFPDHVVMAIEPVRENVQKIQRLVRSVKNVRALHGGLGDITPANGSYDPRLLNKKSRMVTFGTKTGSSMYPVFSIDALFRNATLSLAHLDVEGHEPQVLKGATRTIGRDRPILVTESHERHAPLAHNQTMCTLHHFDYEAYRLEKPCGRWRDCRNYVSIPKELVNINALLKILWATSILPHCPPSARTL